MDATTKQISYLQALINKTLDGRPEYVKVAVRGVDVSKLNRHEVSTLIDVLKLERPSEAALAKLLGIEIKQPASAALTIPFSIPGVRPFTSAAAHTETLSDAFWDKVKAEAERQWNVDMHLAREQYRRDLQKIARDEEARQTAVSAKLDEYTDSDWCAALYVSRHEQAKRETLTQLEKRWNALSAKQQTAVERFVKRYAITAQAKFAYIPATWLIAKNRDTLDMMFAFQRGDGNQVLVENTCGVQFGEYTLDIYDARHADNL